MSFTLIFRNLIFWTKQHKFSRLNSYGLVIFVPLFHFQMKFQGKQKESPHIYKQIIFPKEKTAIEQDVVEVN